MLAILSSLNAHNLPIFQPILMLLVSKFMIHRALSDKTYLSLGLLSPLTTKHNCLAVSPFSWVCMEKKNNFNELEHEMAHCMHEKLDLWYLSEFFLFFEI